MQSISLDRFIIEVTRRCNMGCAHCLRGDAQNLDITNALIDKALENVTHINEVIFSGGEPSLNVSAIRHTLEVCKEKGISVYSFYVVTNGKALSADFIMATLEWFAFVVDNGGEPECCGVSLSQDVFHEPVDSEYVKMLRGLSFFSEDDHKTDWGVSPLIHEGRAATLAGDWETRPLNIYEPAIYEEAGTITVEEDLYLSANGEIRSSCDTSYDDDRATIGNLADKSLVDILLDAKDNASGYPQYRRMLA